MGSVAATAAEGPPWEKISQWWESCDLGDRHSFLLSCSRPSFSFVRPGLASCARVARGVCVWVLHFVTPHMSGLMHRWLHHVELATPERYLVIQLNPGLYQKSASSRVSLQFLRNKCRDPDSFFGEKCDICEPGRYIMIFARTQKLPGQQFLKMCLKMCTVSPQLNGRVGGGGRWMQMVTGLKDGDRF